LRAMQKPQPERVTETSQPVAVHTPAPKPAAEPQSVAKPETKPVVAEPKQEPKQEPQQAPKTVTPKPAAKPDTMEMNGIQVIVEKNGKDKAPATKPAEQPKPKTETKPAEQPASQPARTTQPEKVNGMNIFVLDPYAIAYKSAYSPFTSRPVYENNKTKFILARPGDTYQKLAASMQMKEQDLRQYNDVYDGSEPIEDEVVYLEMKKTKSSVPYHTLQEGDTYRYIAQKYGIQLKILIKRNSGNINSYNIGDQICIGCN